MEKIRKFLHDYLGWGYPLNRIGGDEFQPTYSCRYCKDEICQDSQLNWFHLKTTP